MSTIAMPATAVRPDLTLSDDERQRCEIWTRVMGYHRPVSSFNTGKKGEFAERRHFEESRSGLTGLHGPIGALAAGR